MIEFAKEQCEIFPEDSYMGKYLRETIKILQADPCCNCIEFKRYAKEMGFEIEQEPCEDAVSREDVIKAIDHHTFDTDDGLCLDEDISIILEKLPPVKPTQNWIPVSERLPSIKNYQRKYLVTLKDKTVCDAMFTECDGKHWWNYNYDDVIAWQPLPEPYTENLD